MHKPEKAAHGLGKTKSHVKFTFLLYHLNLNTFHTAQKFVLLRSL